MAVVKSQVHWLHQPQMSDMASKDCRLDSGVIILSGGRDVTGNLLLTVPTTKLGELAELSTTTLSALFIRMVAISRYLKCPPEGAAAHTTAMACVADLRQATAQTIQQLVESIELVEHQHRGTIAAVYFLKPRSKSKATVLKKLLGMKPSKKRPRVPLFKIALLKTVQDLYTQVDVSHLTLDICGTLKYSHHAWMHLYDVVVRCIEEGEETLAKLPSVRDRVDLLQEYEPDNQSSIQLQQLLSDLTEKFQIIITESSLPACLTNMKQTLFQLDNASSNSLFSSLHPSLLTGMCAYLRDQYTKLDHWNTSLEEAWRVTENRFTILIQINRHRERAKEIERKICDHYHPLLREHPIVGRTLSQAELYRAHFTTTLYEPAKELLSQATEILEAVHKLKSSVAGMSSGAAGGGGALLDSINSTDFVDISKCLTISIQPFTNHMQQLQQVYVGIHVFHLLFEKALNWYKKVLKFLPESVLSRCLQDAMVTSNSNGPGQDGNFQNPQAYLVFMPPEWLGAVRVFLDRHPPPREEHIDRLDMSPPYLVDKKLRAQARSLALRLRLLQRLMSNTRLPSKLVAAILDWKVELFGSSHATEKSSPHSPAVSPTKERPRSLGSAQRHFSNSNSLPLGLQLTHKTSSNVRFDNHSADHLDVKSQHRNSGNADNSTNSSLPSSVGRQMLGDNESSTDALAEKREAMITKVQMRKSLSKSSPRAKSVEFSFNSSSTDGSVFDYEKAISQVRQTGQMHLGRDARVPHTRVAQRKHKWSSSDLKTMPWVNAAEGFPDQALSDPSFSSTRNDYDQLQPIRGSGKVPQEHSMYLKQNATDGEDLQEYKSLRDNSLSNHQSLLRDRDTFTLPLARPRSKGNVPVKRELDINLDALDEMSSSEERFIGLSSYVDPLQMQEKTSMRFGSVDNLLSSVYNNPDEEEAESGIDTMENARLDPYDSVVKKIRAISASELPNFEKLKMVSSLIANSSIAKSRSQTQEQTMNSKLSFSTFDLRQTEEGDMSAQYHKKRNSYLSAMPIPEMGERPVSAVLRMKENLAKSMEELNTYTKNLSLKNSPPPPVKKDLTPPPKPARRRYVSKLSITPNYTNPTSQQVAGYDSESASEAVQHKDKASSPFLDHGLVSTPVEDKTEPSFENEFDVKNTSNLSLHPSGHYQRWDGSESTENQGTKPNDLRQSTNFDDLETESPGPGDKTPQRPNSLLLFSGRNFISPSFLKPSTTSSTLNKHPNIETTQNLNNTSSQEKEFPFQLKDSDNNSKETDRNKGRIQSHPSHLHHREHPPQSLPRKNSATSSNHPPEEKPSKTDTTTKTSKAEDKLKMSHSGDIDDPFLHRFKSQSFEGTSVDPRRRSLSDTHRWSKDSSMSFHADSSPEFDRKWMDIPSIDVQRLSNEAEIELTNQDEVANSLRKTQMILEEEEKRRNGMDLYEINDGDDEGDDGAFIMEDNPANDLNHSDTVDNGYGSWASKLISQPSTSSEGIDPESLLIESPFQFLSGSFNQGGSLVASRRRTFAKTSEGTSSSEKAHETPWLDSPTGDPPKFE